MTGELDELDEKALLSLYKYLLFLYNRKEEDKIKRIFRLINILIFGFLDIKSRASCLEDCFECFKQFGDSIFEDHADFQDFLTEKSKGG